jgi:phage terminase large subunit
VAIAQRDIIDIVNEERNFLVVRNTGNTLRQSVFEERCKVIKQWGLTNYFDIRQGDMQLVYKPTQCAFFFRGLDDVEKIKSLTPANGVLTDLRVEEATETSQDKVFELHRRMRGQTSLIKRSVYTFNPTLKTHWIAKKHFKGQDIGFLYNKEKLIFRTTYKDNAFLTQQDINFIMSLSGYQGQVYRDGLWGVLGDLIFNTWEIIDCKNTEFDVTRYGIDFGFSSDPAAVIKVGYIKSKKEIYIQEGFYIRGGTNDVLAAKAKATVRDNTVWCDSAEPKSIQELRNAGENRISAYPAKKGPDSVWHSLQWLQQQKIYVDKRCTDMINELSAYQWKKSKSGETMQEPAESDDHLIAALRYATERDRAGCKVNIAA